MFHSLFQFNCTPECPDYLPYTVKDLEKDENKVVCVDRSHPEIARLLDKTSEYDDSLPTIKNNFTYYFFHFFSRLFNFK